MPLIDVRCTNDHVTEVMRPLAMHPQTPPCPTCDAPTTQIFLPPHARATPDPVIVFRAPDGSFRFPGDPNGLYAGRCRADGMEQIELRGAADVRRFEQHMNRVEYSRAMRRVERQEQMREARETANRSELRHRMQSMSARGRAIAQAAMRRNDHAPRRRAQEAGFMVEVYSMDRSNRQESRDAQGRRRRD